MKLDKNYYLEYAAVYATLASHDERIGGVKAPAWREKCATYLTKANRLTGKE